MTHKLLPVYFTQVCQDDHLSNPTEKIGPPDLHPLMKKLPNLPSQGPSLKTANCHTWMGGVSSGMQNISQGFQEIKSPLSLYMEGSLCLILPSGFGIGCGIANTYDSYKQYSRSDHIHDLEGKRLAVLNGAETGTATIGDGANLTLQSFSMVQNVERALHHPIHFTGIASSIQGGLSWASSILFAISYALSGLRTMIDLIYWLKGREWRQTLVRAENPSQTLYRELKKRVRPIQQMNGEALKEEGLKAGARWLEKVEAASKGKLKIKNKKEVFRKLVINDPTIISRLIGRFSRSINANQELIRFGKYMALQNECAHFEADCIRKLGKTALEAIKTGDTEALKKALEVKEWIGMSAKIAVAVLGIGIMIALAIVVTNSPIGVALILAGVAALAMMFISDTKSLKEYLQNGAFKGRDRLFFYFTLILSVISFLGLVTLTIATGGIAPFLISLILAATWLIINLYSAYLIWKLDHRPWKIQKVVSLVAYRKFLETNPREFEIESVSKKMTPEDQNYVSRLKNPLENLKEQEVKLEQQCQAELHRLIENIRAFDNPFSLID